MFGGELTDRRTGPHVVLPMDKKELLEQVGAFAKESFNWDMAHAIS